MKSFRMNAWPLLVGSLVGLAGCAAAPAAYASVISVDFQTNAAFAGRNSVDFTGVESEAAAANSIFADADIWNYLEIPPGPTFSSSVPSTALIDSDGLGSGVSISLTGNFTAANDTPIDGNGSHGIENDYFVNPFGQDVAYSITGLPADILVALYLYSPDFSDHDSDSNPGSFDRAFTLTANGGTINVPAGAQHNALAYVNTGATGSISGVWSTMGNEGDWSGFQIGYPVAAVPLPAASVLLGSGLGLFGLFGVAKKRKFSAAVS